MSGAPTLPMGVQTRRDAGVSKTRKPLYIFDLDGTLSDAAHRVSLIKGIDHEPDWDAFFVASADDTPILPTIDTMQKLSMMAEVWIWTGRSDQVRSETLAWLNRHTTFKPVQLDRILRMRAAGDHRPDHVLKAEWLDELSTPDRMRLVAVFEDRASVVDMWRDRGVTCYQVANGDF